MYSFLESELERQLGLNERKKNRLIRFVNFWQGRQDSNPQPPVLETDALPIELLPVQSTI